ncbi:MAG: amino acid permease [Spirochaetales bacterium]|nr:amino acid permease [Spirochaetales bacterium]
MPKSQKKSETAHLKKALGVFSVFSIASGAMISSGLFILPGIVYAKAGPSIILGYFLASLLIIPAMFSKTELATAMPKSGGTYFFVHRSLGPLFGTFAGFASWFSLSLKSAFALVGIGIFLEPLVQNLLLPAHIITKGIAVLFTVVFCLLNILGIKESARLQNIMLFLLLLILAVFNLIGINNLTNIQNFNPFLKHGWLPIITVTGMIFISYGGLTKIASVAEEIKNPNKTIPRGMFAAFSVVTVIYVLTVFITIGVSGNKLENSFTPISDAAKVFLGQPGFILLAAAAMFAFITTANAGLLSASRNPLAMAKDNLIPSFFSRMNVKLKTPTVSIIITSTFMILIIIFLDLEQLVKVASTMMLILFAFDNLSLILMRESKIISYKPSYKAPLYPYLQIVGTILYVVLIIEMGLITFLITSAFFVISFLWYILYSKSRAERDSALIHIVERVTSKEIKSRTITDELQNILIERDQIIEDRFDKIIKQASILDIDKEIDVAELFRIIASTFSKKFKIKHGTILKLLKAREAESSTAIHAGLAIPHIIIPGTSLFDIVLIRCKEGIHYGPEIPLVNIVFALVGTKDERNFHLQALMAIAQIVQHKDFEHTWMKTKSLEDLRSLILLTQRLRKGNA